ncbi:MAG: DUF378 domain-containing protein [Candidatus Liptonbacteria bacterium]|nr:DUF378 domain-containing protein [Candidatus Liptonbacteria bacterium]
MNGDKLHKITFTLLLVGGLNWLLVGIFNWDIGLLFGGPDAAITKIIYVLVGISAIYEIATHKKNCKMCSSGASSGMPAK